jgi:hypothetical protein
MPVARDGIARLGSPMAGRRGRRQRDQVLAVLEPAVFHLVQEDEFTRAAPPRVDTTKLRRSVAAMLLCDGKTSAVLRRHVHRRDEAFGELG